MTDALARLAVLGAPAPCAAPRDAPPFIRALLERWGPGLLCGLFEVVGDGAVWRERQAWLRALRAHGWFAGLSARRFDALVVGAVSATGHALATSGEEHFLLTCGGAVASLGASDEALLEALPARASLLFPCLAWEGGERGWAPKFDWGVERTYALPSHGGRAAWLAALEGGGDADALLPEALVARPPGVAMLELLAELCGPRGDALDDEVRADAITPLARKVQRRFEGLPELPAGLFARAPWRDAATRAWASSPNPVGVRPGPFAPVELARARALPEVEPLPEDARAPLAAPALDAERLLARWLVKWDALPEVGASPALARVRERATGLPATLRFAVARRLAWEGLGDACPDGLEESAVELIRALDARPIELGGPHLVEAWPLVLVFLVHASRFGYETSEPARAALFGVRDPELGSALVALAERDQSWAVAQRAWDDEVAPGPRLIDGERPAGAELARLLAMAKRRGAPECVIALVAGRVDDEEVYGWALGALRKWPTIVAPALAQRPGARTVAALREVMAAKKLEAREAAAKALADLGDAAARAVYEETKRKIDESI